MEKYIKDGMVAVLVSPGFGAGWSSWDHKDGRDILFDHRLVEAFLEGGSQAVIQLSEELWGEDSPYAGGADELQVEWIPQGEMFYLHEYDGNEWIVRQSDFLVA